MFRKRVKKTFPPGTFIPTPARVVAIIQLCLAFTALIWACGYPFMGDLYATKSKLLLYQNIMGIAPTHDKAYKMLMEDNAIRFQKLPEEQQTRILNKYKELNAQIDMPFLSKIKRSFHILAIEISPYEQAWIFFALFISFLVLLRIEGGTQAAWLLPLIIVLYGLSQLTGSHKNNRNEEERLFPTEEQLVQNYLKHPLNANILEQQAELKHAWKLYLVDIWAHETPSENPEILQKQSEKGEFTFNLARIQAVSSQKGNGNSSYNQKISLGMLILYFMWNIFFACCVNYYQFLPCKHSTLSP